MRIDGDFTLYVLKTRCGGRGEWFSPDYDYFGAPPDFTASDDCWQRLGIHGTFVKERGIEAMTYMVEKHPACDWKLQKLTISQHHQDVAVMRGEHPMPSSPPTQALSRKPQKRSASLHG